MTDPNPDGAAKLTDVEAPDYIDRSMEDAFGPGAELGAEVDAGADADVAEISNRVSGRTSVLVSEPIGAVEFRQALMGPNTQAAVNALKRLKRDLKSENRFVRETAETLRDSEQVKQDAGLRIVNAMEGLSYGEVFGLVAASTFLEIDLSDQQQETGPFLTQAFENLAEGAPQVNLDRINKLLIALGKNYKFAPDATDPGLQAALRSVFASLFNSDGTPSSLASLKKLMSMVERRGLDFGFDSVAKGPDQALAA